jgi:hypothetical protein
MNAETEAKIEAALAAARGKALRRFEETVREIAGSHDGRLPFATSATIHEAARAAQKNTLKLLDAAVPEVSSTLKTMDAFGLLKRAMVNHSSDLSGIIQQWRGTPLHPANLSLVGELFAANRHDLLVNIEAYRDRFKNQGGPPFVWDWEGAKAHVRASFPKGLRDYRGLRTEIAEMMADWFEGRVGESPGRSLRMKHASAMIEEMQRPKKIL